MVPASKIWAIVRFSPPKTEGDQEIVRGRLVKGNVKRLDKLPSNPRLVDFFTMRFNNTSNHCLQSATKALRGGMSEEVVLACLLHDVVQEISAFMRRHSR